MAGVSVPPAGISKMEKHCRNKMRGGKPIGRRKTLEVKLFKINTNYNSLNLPAMRKSSDGVGDKRVREIPLLPP
jgi:hypothetical protein